MKARPRAAQNYNKMRMVMNSCRNILENNNKIFKYYAFPKTFCFLIVKLLVLAVVLLHRSLIDDNNAHIGSFSVCRKR